MGDEKAVLKYENLILDADYTYKEDNVSSPLLVLTISEKIPKVRIWNLDQERYKISTKLILPL